MTRRFTDARNNVSFSDPDLIEKVHTCIAQALADIVPTVEDSTFALTALKTLSKRVPKDEVESKTETGKFLEWVADFIQVTSDPFFNHGKDLVDVPPGLRDTIMALQRNWIGCPDTLGPHGKRLYKVFGFEEDPRNILKERLTDVELCIGQHIANKTTSLQEKLTKHKKSEKRLSRCIPIKQSSAMNSASMARRYWTIKPHSRLVWKRSSCHRNMRE